VQAASSRRFEKHAPARPERGAVQKVVVLVSLGSGEVFGTSVAGVDDALALFGPDIDSGAAALFFARKRSTIGLLENGE
jgi:hypothetical protein